MRTCARREANGMPLMTAELIIAGEETRKNHAVAAPIRCTSERRTSRAGCTASRRSSSSSTCSPRSCRTRRRRSGTRTRFRSCLIPGQSYARLTPFGGDPPENNIAKAQKLPLAAAAGLWRLAEEIFAQLLVLHEGGMSHGDAELHNSIVCPAPLEPILIDFEAADARRRWRARPGRSAAGWTCCRCCARRSTSSARSAASRAPSASARGICSASSSGRRSAFTAPSRRRPKSECERLIAGIATQVGAAQWLGKREKHTGNLPDTKTIYRPVSAARKMASRRAKSLTESTRKRLKRRFRKLRHF